MIRALRPRHRPFSTTAFALRPLSSPAPRPLATLPPAALGSLELFASPYKPIPSSVEVTSSNSVRAEETTLDKPTAATAEQEEVQASASLGPLDPLPLPTPEGPLSFVAEKIRDSESRDAAQLKIESWAKEWYMVQEQAKVERRSTEKQASPSAYAHVSTDSGFTKFVWDWTQALEERFRRNGTRGMSKRSENLCCRCSMSYRNAIPCIDLFLSVLSTRAPKRLSLRSSSFLGRGSRSTDGIGTGRITRPSRFESEPVALALQQETPRS